MEPMKAVRKIFLLGRNLSAADCIRRILEYEGYLVAGIGKHGSEVLKLVDAEPPDILMVGSELEDAAGLSVMRMVGRQHPDTKRILFVCEADTELAREALDEGVNGLLSPDGLMPDLLECVAAVYAGKDYIYGPHRAALTKRFGPQMWLTPGERKVFDLVGDGLTSPQIADRLFISKNTVNHHRANMAAKLGLSGPNALALYAARYHNGKR